VLTCLKYMRQLMRVLHEFFGDKQGMDPSAIAANFGKAGRERREALAAAVRPLYRAADANGDGQVTRAELIRALRRVPELRTLLGLPEVVHDQQRDLLEGVYAPRARARTHTPHTHTIHGARRTAASPHGSSGAAAVDGQRST
jgi:hypothetical protein